MYMYDIYVRMYMLSKHDTYHRNGWIGNHLRKHLFLLWILSFIFFVYISFDIISNQCSTRFLLITLLLINMF